MNTITLACIENAINFWRNTAPATGEERVLSPEVSALGDIYASMIYHKQQSVALENLSDKQIAALQGYFQAQQPQHQAVEEDEPTDSPTL